MSNTPNYCIDMDKFMEFVTKYSVKNSDTAISQIYSVDETEENGELTMISKDVSESKSNYSDTLYNIRYDFIRQLLSTITNIIPYENSIAKNITNLDEMGFAQRLCFNTLLSKSIIKDMNEIENV